jgi:hypothetical protein
LNLLPFDERGDFPTDAILLKTRIRLLSDAEMCSTVKEIMGSDLLVVGTQMEQVK